MAAILRRLCRSTSEICPRAILTIPAWVSQMLYGVRAELLRASKAARDRGAPFESAHSGPAGEMTSPRCFGLNPKTRQWQRERLTPYGSTPGTCWAYPHKETLHFSR